MIHSFARFIPIAEKIIPRKSAIPILTYLCIHNGFMIATDLEITAMMKIEDTRSYLLPLKIIKTILKTKPSFIEIELTNDDKIRINYDHKAVVFPMADSVDEYPQIETKKLPHVGSWRREVFLELHTQLPYCSTDEMRPALNGIFVRQNSTLSSCATDGHALRYIRDLNPDKRSTMKKDFECIIPVRVIPLLARCATEQVKVEANDESIRFIMDKEITIESRLIEATFPKFENVLPEEFCGEIEFERKKMLALTTEAKPFANRINHLSEFTITPDELRMKVEDPEEDTTWLGKLAVNNGGKKELRIGFDVHLLETVLKTINSQQIKWAYTSPTSASILHANNGDAGNITNLIMPIRLKEKEGTDAG